MPWMQELDMPARKLKKRKYKLSKRIPIFGMLQKIFKPTPEKSTLTSEMLQEIFRSTVQSNMKLMEILKLIRILIVLSALSVGVSIASIFIR